MGPTAPDPGEEQHLLTRVESHVKQSVIETFRTMSGEAPSNAGNFMDTLVLDGVIGAITLMGEVPMSLVLGLSRNAAISMSAQFAGFEIDFDSPDMKDVVGEMVNVLAGDVIARLETAGVKSRMSLPTTVSGSDLGLTLPESLVLIAVPDESKTGCFWVQVRCPQHAVSGEKSQCLLCGR